VILWFSKALVRLYPPYIINLLLTYLHEFPSTERLEAP